MRSYDHKTTHTAIKEHEKNRNRDRKLEQILQEAMGESNYEEWFDYRVELPRVCIEHGSTV